MRLCNSKEPLLLFIKLTCYPDIPRSRHQWIPGGASPGAEPAWTESQHSDLA